LKSTPDRRRGRCAEDEDEDEDEDEADTGSQAGTLRPRCTFGKKPLEFSELCTGWSLATRQSPPATLHDCWRCGLTGEPNACFL
jgi:hypothetical protein